MIRNWVGQTGDEEFYEACDRHGIMVWQDFWLANPVDGPNPYNEPMFMANAADYVRRIRKHPSIALYCGRNEGYPPESLNRQLRETVDRLAPHSLYFPSSADDGVSGHGPYRALPAEEYFKQQTGKLHSERESRNGRQLLGKLRQTRLHAQPLFGKDIFRRKSEILSVLRRIERSALLKNEISVLIFSSYIKSFVSRKKKLHYLKIGCCISVKTIHITTTFATIFALTRYLVFHLFWNKI